MTRLDDILRGASFALTALLLIASPWLFGAWEMWWFWPFAGLLFAATGLFGVRRMLSVRVGPMRFEPAGPIRLLLFAWLPFMAYALVRSIQAGVRMNAERSFLLWLTPLLIALLILAGFSSRQRKALGILLSGNAILLGAYGIANYYLAGNARVLWVPGYPEYQAGYLRATGSYFCPDHFASLMELGLALALGLLFAAAVSRRLRAAAALLAIVALGGIVLSKSRGAGIASGVMLLCALWMGPAHWPRRRAWLLRAAAIAAVAVGLALAAAAGGHYLKRFKEYPWRHIEESDRYQMSAAALRAWKTAPVFGIGPGMHQNLWPHFAATADGDREKGIWPSVLNNAFHSYEVHNDWVQLIEETGLTGLILFLFAAGATARALLRGLPPRPGGGTSAFVLAALLASSALAVHSFGDFVLQIPATTWLLGALAGLGLADAPPPEAEA